MEIIKSLSDVATVVAFIAIATVPQAVQTYFTLKQGELE
jgi:hypothetical protein